MTGPIRIGIIGCGGISHGHVKRLKVSPNVFIVGLADINPEAANKLAETAKEDDKKPPIFTDYKEMLDEVEMDAVGIFTPHTLHYEEAKDALEKDLHVLLEKPMVCSVAHAKELLALSEAKNKVLLISYQRHYMPIYRYAKKIIEEGKLGEIKVVMAFLTQNWLGPYGWYRWRIDPKLSGGGQLMDSGSHLVDIILWLTDLEPAEIFAFIDNKGTEVDIFSVISVKFNNGALGTIIVSGDAPSFEEETYIWGSEGTIFLRGGKMLHQLKDGSIHEPQDLPPGSDPDTNFINAIRKIEPVYASGIWGLRVIQLTQAAYESARTGKPCQPDR